MLPVTLAAVRLRHRRISGTYWPASLAELMSSRAMRDSALKNKVGWAVEMAHQVAKIGRTEFKALEPT